MNRRAVYIAPRVSTLNEDWFHYMSAEARCAWIYLLAYVKVNAPSQKDPGRAARLSERRAADQFRVSPASIEELEAAAKVGDPVTGPALRIEDGCWIVLELGVFQSEKTIARHAAANEDEPTVEPPNKVEEPQADSRTPFVGQTWANGDNSPRTVAPCHATGSGSGSDSGSGIPPSAGEGGASPAGASASARGGAPPSEPRGPGSPAEGGAPSEPYRSVQAVLARCAKRCGGLDPTPDDVRPHCRDGSPVRKLLAKLGVEPTASLWWYAQSVRTGKGGMSWTAIWNQHASLLASMPKPPPEEGPRRSVRVDPLPETTAFLREEDRGKASGLLRKVLEGAVAE